MIKKCLYNVLVFSIFTISVLVLNPIGVSAEWKQDDTGWWYAEDGSWLIGWKEIDGKWYYFGQDGYMAHATTVNSYTLGSDGAWIQSDISTSVINKNNTSTEENQNSNSFNVDVSIKYNIYLDAKVKGTNPNIIKATRQALFANDCYFAKFKHYNGYSIYTDILIFDVKEIGTDEWEVDFYSKRPDEKEYDTIGYGFVTVDKQKDGIYIGSISGSTPINPSGETY